MIKPTHIRNSVRGRKNRKRVSERDREREKKENLKKEKKMSTAFLKR